MEYSTHWATMVKCSLCGEIPESAPLHQCPFQHQYCFNCIKELRKNYRGNIKGGATCAICKISGVFAQSKINSDFIRKIKIKPGIGRPYRYNSNVINKGYNYSRTQEVSTNQTQVTVEGLFRLPADEIRRLLHRRNGLLHESDATNQESTEHITSNSTIHPNNAYLSKIPIKCPHNPCNKMVTISSFVTHFKHEHACIPKYTIERGKELCIPCDISIIEHDNSYCIAMITVYEINKIDVNKSRSSQSVIKTCSKFCQQVPINSFWLMVSGSSNRRPYCAYVLYWLFTTSEENYQCTIELASSKDSIALSTYCGINTSSKTENFVNIADSLNCLIISKASLGAILREGPQLNLRITVH